VVAVRTSLAALGASLLAIPFAGTAHAASQPATWNFSQIRMGQAQAAGHDGSGVTVAVIDTWVDWQHPDLGGRVLAGADCTGGTCTPGRVAPDKCEAHGTHVAGTIASRTYGVAPAARILPLRVLKWDGSQCSGTSGDLAVAVRYAASHGARVVNISAGAAVPLASHDTSLDDAVAYAAQRGAVVVFAAGNASVPVADSYGGNALIVAATGRDKQLASYSQYGAGVDLAAPGGDPPGDTCSVTECVVSTWSSGSNHDLFAALAGTSMAAPHVSGIAALLFAQRSRTRADVVARLEGTAHPLANAGHGLVDASGALGASASGAPPATSPAPAPAVVLRPRTAPATTAPKPVATTKPKPEKKPVRKRATPAPAATTAAPEPQPVEPPLAAATTRPAAGRGAPSALAALLLVATASATAAEARRRRPQL
jgi:subtilisin family serine protease